MGVDEKLVLAPKRDELFAESLQDAKAGQLVALSKEGEILGKRGMTASMFAPRVLLPSLGIGVGIGLVSAVTGIGLGWSLSVGVLLGWGLLGLAIRKRARFRRVLTLASEKRFGEASAACAVLAQKARGEERALYEHELGRLAYLEGDHEEALVHLRSAAELWQSTRRRQANVGMVLTDGLLAGVLAILERLDEAEAVLRRLQDAPSTEMFEYSKQFVAMRIAFGRTNASRLAGEDVYEWAKSVLSTNILGASAVVLAWIFSELGDREMAVHMLSESPARLGMHNIRESDPALFRFLERSWREWKLEEKQPFAELLL